MTCEVGAGGREGHRSPPSAASSSLEANRWYRCPLAVAEELVQVAYAYASGPSGQQHDDQSAILAAYHTIMEVRRLFICDTALSSLAQQLKIGKLSCSFGRLQGLLYRGQPPQELSSRTLALRQQLVHTGLMADAKMHSLFLEAALIAGDVEVPKPATGQSPCGITLRRGIAWNLLTHSLLAVCRAPRQLLSA